MLVEYDQSNEHSQEELRRGFQTHVGAAQVYAGEADTAAEQSDHFNSPGLQERVQLSLMHSQLAMAFAAGLHGGIGT